MERKKRMCITDSSQKQIFGVCAKSFKELHQKGLSRFKNENLLSIMPGSVLQMTKITVMLIVWANVQYNEDISLQTAAALPLPRLVIVSQLRP